MFTKTIFIMLMLLTLQSHASFTENTRRYVSPKDIFNLWTQKYPVLSSAKVIKGLPMMCWSIRGENLNFTGGVNPAIGKAAVDLPPPNFVRWMGSCAADIIELQFRELSAQLKNKKLWLKYYPQEILDSYGSKDNEDEPYAGLYSVKWSELKPAERKLLVRYTIEEMIGPEPVLKDLGLVKSMTDLIQLIEGALVPDFDLEVPKVMQKVLLAVSLREEFIIY